MNGFYAPFYKNKSYSLILGIVLTELNNLGVVYEINNRKILKGKEIDIYIPDAKFGIEINGLYWHSNLYKSDDYHLNKTKLCEQQEIQLIHIFEDEVFEKLPIIISLISSKINIIKNKIYARKTIIKEINDNAIIKNFLENNHLQGVVGSNVKLGLFYNNELVSLMTFGKKRLSMGNKIRVDNEYEMYRFCNKLNTTIIGGASKLLTYFIKTYNPKSIISYANRRYSNGKLYKQLGFEFKGNSDVNYFYVNSRVNEYKRHYRFGFRKDILVKEGFDASKTEHQIMLERGYSKIYDCGNMRFEISL